MRRFHWSKMPESEIEKTIWLKLTDEKVKLNIDQLENLFGEKKKDPKITEQKKQKSSKKRIEKVQLIEPQRANNVEISLSRFKMSPTMIADAILEMNEKKLPAERLAALMKMVPNDEEIAIVQSYDGPSEKLRKSEQFFKVISSIPGIRLRLELTLFRAQFQQNLSELDEKVKIIQNATQEIKNSQKFKELLQIILAIGNYLNGGTRQGGAYGFKLKTLLKLKSQKSLNGKVTLLMYIVQYVKHNKKEILDFPDEWKHVTEASSIEASFLEGEVNKFWGKLNMIKRKTDQPDNGGRSDKFHSVMSSFIRVKHTSAKALKNRYDESKMENKKLQESLGESNIKWESFFTIFKQFVSDWERTKQQIRKNEERTANKQKSADAKRKQKQRIVVPSNIPRSESAMGDVLSSISDTRSMRKQLAARRETRAPGYAVDLGAVLKERRKNKR